MTTTIPRTSSRSAYPKPVVELLPAARALADELGRLPSRNRLMSALKVGAPKANALRAALQQRDAAPVDESPEVAPTAEPARLHLVPAPDGSPSPDPVTEQSPVPSPDTEGTATGDTPSLPDTASAQDSTPVGPDTHPSTGTDAATPVRRPRPVRTWPVLLLAVPAFVAIWSGWVGLGGLTGFGVVHPLPGIWDGARLNTAVTLPVGVETYAAYALRVWLSGGLPDQARRFARWSAIGALALGALGQVTYHLMAAGGVTRAPWPITTLVACLPVAVLGMGAALAHLLHSDNHR